MTGTPHLLQNLESGGSSMPHDPQSSPVAVSPPPPSPPGSTSVSFHRCSVMSDISPGHLRREVLRPSYVAVFETPVTAEVKALAHLGLGADPRVSTESGGQAVPKTLPPRTYDATSPDAAICECLQPPRPTSRLMVIYPPSVIAAVATDVGPSRARLWFASSTRIVVMCRMIEKGTR